MARMTYMGNCIVTIDNEPVPILCGNMNSGVEVNLGFFDHVIGLRDTNFTQNNSKKKAANNDETVGGYHQIQKRIYRYNPGIFKGKISGPISVSDDYDDINIFNLIERAITGKTIPTIEFIYLNSFTGGAETKGHKVTESVIDSLVINVVSGDVANFDISFVSKDYPAAATTTPPPVLGCSKLLTWDKCYISTDNFSGYEFQSFSINIKNTVIPIYTSLPTPPPPTPGGVDPYYFGPVDLRLGMQEVSGSFSTYNWNIWNSFTDIMSFKLGDNNSWKLHVVYKPNPSNATGGGEPYLAVIPFTGASDTSVWISAEA